MKSSAETARGAIRLCAILAALSGAARAEIASFEIVDDGIPAPLTATPGDVARGRQIVADRQKGLCLLCHTGPFPEQRFQGSLAPDLAGAGARATPAQLRLRLVDPARLNPNTIMPGYHRVDGLTRVAPSLRGKPILSESEIEDVVAFLVTLR